MTLASAAVAEDQALPGFELVPLGPPFVVDSVALARRGPAPTLFDCETALVRVKKIFCGVRYWLGDLMNLTETLFHEEASQLIDQSFLSEQEVKDYTRVSAGVAPTVRSHAPSWEHAKAVAHLKSPEEQVTWLDKAHAQDWNARKLATEMAKAANKGKTVMKFWLVVECQTEAKRDKLADTLERQGFAIKKQEALRKVKKLQKPKKGPITARMKRAPKASTKRRR